jgi:copper(I)-binding protein
MKRLTYAVTAIAMLAALLVAGTLSAQEGSMASPEAQMASPEAEAMAMGAAYMVIENSGTEPDRLTGGTTPVAGKVEIHEVVDEGGVMQMRPLADGLEIPAGGRVELKPGGYHVMLIGLTESLTPGATYELTLTFATAGELVLTVPVYASEEAATMATPAAAVTAGSISISSAWSRMAPAMGEEQPQMAGASAAAFMKITNNGSEPDRLVAGRTAIATAIEIHEVKAGEGGVMQMSPLTEGLEIPAGGTVELKPGGYHVMLFGIMQDLNPGFTYELTLVFERAGEVTITVPVLAAEPTEEMFPPTTVGEITIAMPWTRPAPAMGAQCEVEAAATPECEE